jgi:Dna[CI] antecedent DciA-like protein
VKRDDTLEVVKSLTTLSDSVLPALLARAPLTPEKIDFSWRLAVGPQVHRACTIALTSGTLAVSVPDRAWAREIERSIDVILSRMQRLLGRDAVRRIECRVCT